MTNRKNEVVKSIELDLACVDNKLAEAFRLHGLAAKNAGKANNALHTYFVDGGKSVEDTLSPLKNDGVTLNPESKATMTVEQFMACVGHYAKSIGKLSVWSTSPEWLKQQKASANAAKKIAIKALENAKGDNQLAKANKALAKAKADYEKFDNMAKERSAIRSDATSTLKNVRKAILRREFNDHKLALMADGKSEEQAKQGGAMLINQLKEKAGVTVSTGLEHYAVEDKPLEYSEIVESINATIRKAANEIAELADDKICKQVKDELIELLIKKASEPNH